MTIRNLKGFAPVSGTAAMVLCGLLFLGAAFTANANAEDDKSHNSLQGTWRLTITVRDCQTGGELRLPFAALATFAKGGTLTVVTAGQPPSLFTPALGVWRRTERNKYSAVSENFVFSPAGVPIQTHRLTRAIELDNDADHFTDTINSRSSTQTMSRLERAAERPTRIASN